MAKKQIIYTDEFNFKSDKEKFIFAAKYALAISVGCTFLYAMMILIALVG